MYTPTDSDLREFIALQTTIKIMQKRLDEIKEVCKERGSFCSNNYTCTVLVQERLALLGLDHVQKALGKEILEKHELIKMSTFQVVKVARKLDGLSGVG